VDPSWFYSLVDKINSSIGQDLESKSLIGVLDIYGFENFKTNSCLTGIPYLFILTSICFSVRTQWKIVFSLKVVEGETEALFEQPFSTCYSLTHKAYN
jgi:hypothetical protein